MSDGHSLSIYPDSVSVVLTISSLAASGCTQIVTKHTIGWRPCKDTEIPPLDHQILLQMEPFLEATRGQRCSNRAHASNLATLCMLLQHFHPLLVLRTNCVKTCAARRVGPVCLNIPPPVPA